MDVNGHAGERVIAFCFARNAEGRGKASLTLANAHATAINRETLGAQEGGRTPAGLTPGERQGWRAPALALTDRAIVVPGDREPECGSRRVGVIVVGLTRVATERGCRKLSKSRCHRQCSHAPGRIKVGTSLHSHVPE
jgi:hypothetical protein